MANLRCLTIHQPWAGAILHAGKRIENREAPPPEWLIGQVLGLHAGKKYDWAGEQVLKGHYQVDPAAWPAAANATGAIIGVATVIGWVAPKGGRLTNGTIRQLDEFRQDPWWESPLTGWILDQVVALPEPVPCRGMQGVWWADQPTIARVFEQLPQLQAVTHA
jgi:hypothetical protein